MLPYTKWLSLPLVTRQKIAEIFNIPKLRATHVADNQILDDGYNVADVEKSMSVESLQAYLQVPEKDLFVLFQMLLDKLDGKEPVPENIVQPIPVPAPLLIPKEEMQQVKEIVPAKKKKNAKKAKTNPQN